jgi:predicted DsbA family dithiol-disulfide isomerase
MLLEVWSDFACPWCALGLARLDVALASFEHGAEVDLVHRSFELDPGAPPRRAVSREDAVATKYRIGTDRVRALHDQLTVLGAEVGFTFDFDRVQVGSTFDAHRLAQAARGTPSEEAVVRGLFAANFSEGRLLSDHGVLRGVAAVSGLDEALTAEVLAGDAFGLEVRADEAAAQERDVTGVPYFLINGAWAVPGAQDVETMGIVLRRAWSRLGE